MWLQMRFGGNIGVHAINRTSAAPLNNPSQQLLQQPGGVLGGQGMGGQGMGGQGALSGMNNPMAGLPGAPRPGVRPPNWQRAQALAQQAAQQQAQQQVGQFQYTKGFIRQALKIPKSLPGLVAPMHNSRDGFAIELISKTK